MELRHYVVLLRKWFWLLGLGAVLPAGGAFLLRLWPPPAPVYRATATLLICGASIPEVRDANQGDFRSIYNLERQASTYAHRLSRPSVRQGVMEALGLQQWTADVKVTPTEETLLLTLSVEDRNPELAMKIANLIPEVFDRQNEEAQRKRFAATRAKFAQQLAQVRANLATTSAALQSPGPAQVDPTEQERLQREREQYQITYSFFLRSYQDLLLAEAQMLHPLVLDDPAERPRAPVPRPSSRNAPFYALLGLVAAGALALLIETQANPLRTSQDVQETLGLRVLGTIPPLRRPSGGLLRHPALVSAPQSAIRNPHHEGTKIREGARNAKARSTKPQWREVLCVTQPQSPVSEAYRLLRTQIRFRINAASPRTILVTSPGPAEGRSATVANLGAVLAQDGLAVVVVDANLRQPALHRLLQVPNAQGLASALLADTPDLDGYLQDTGIERLRVLTSGPPPSNPSELLSSEQMASLLQNLAQQADVVLFDTPACLAVADAAVLARQVDGVLLVIGAGQTRREGAVQAAESLRELGANLLGVVLTQP